MFSFFNARVATTTKELVPHEQTNRWLSKIPNGLTCLICLIWIDYIEFMGFQSCRTTKHPSLGKDFEVIRKID